MDSVKTPDSPSDIVSVAAAQTALIIFCEYLRVCIFDVHPVSAAPSRLSIFRNF